MSTKVVNKRLSRYGRDKLRTLDLSKEVIPPDLSHIDLQHNDLKTLDLSPLSNLSDLLTLNLGYNNLSSIDLSPLSECHNLRTIDLAGNNLKTVDLKPLRNCTNIDQILLNGNYIESIDLSPISNFIRLKSFHLWITKEVSNLNLSPFSSCNQLSEFNLSGRDGNITKLNLSPFQGIETLQEFSLYEFPIKNIDITPISSRDLVRLTIEKTNLETIDLSSLNNCSNLREINLNRNKLNQIDLSPLRASPNLRTLGLAKNRLDKIDLSPLSYCPNMKRVQLSDNNFESVDFSPLIYCPRSFKFYNKCEPATPTIWLETTESVFSRMEYRRPTTPYPWQFLRRVADDYGSNKRVQHDIIHSLGLGDFGFIEADMSNLFQSIPHDTPIENVKATVTQFLIDEIFRQVDRKGPTIGLQLERIIERYPSIMVRTPEILENRQKEMETVSIYFDGNELDLRRLWLTAYGFEMLKALDIGLSSSRNMFKKITSSSKELGYKIRISESDESLPSALPKEYIDLVLFFADQDRHHTVRRMTDGELLSLRNKSKLLKDEKHLELIVEQACKLLVTSRTSTVHKIITRLKKIEQLATNHQIVEIIAEYIENSSEPWNFVKSLGTSKFFLRNQRIIKAYNSRRRYIASLIILGKKNWLSIKRAVQHIDSNPQSVFKESILESKPLKGKRIAFQRNCELNRGEIVPLIRILGGIVSDAHRVDFLVLGPKSKDTTSRERNYKAKQTLTEDEFTEMIEEILKS